MLGSRWYAGNLSQSDQNNIVGVINIDSIAETSDLGYMVMVSVVVPIDKMSLLLTVIFSYFVFHEKLSRKAVLGLILMLAGTLLMAVFA